MAHPIFFLKPFQFLLLFLTLLSICGLSTTVEAFQFAPILTFSAVKDPLATKRNSQMLCAEMGGVLASEPTEPTHIAVIAAAKEAGAGSEWYAYLGADTRDPTKNDCSEPYIGDISSRGATSVCYWRWNQGRWLELPDDPSLKYYTPGIGVTFHIGNHYDLADRDAGYVRGYFSFFENSKTSTNKLNYRPGCLLGRDLLVVGNDETSMWSDNLEAGGYKYAGFTHSDSFTDCSWNSNAIESTKDKFLAICEIQVPTRTIAELPEGQPSISGKWWVVYLILLIFACTGIFLIILCCQDREDVEKNKSFMGQYEFDLSDEDDVPPMNASGRWQGSQASIEQFKYYPEPNYVTQQSFQRTEMPSFRTSTFDRYGSRIGFF